MKSVEQQLFMILGISFPGSLKYESHKEVMKLIEEVRKQTIQECIELSHTLEMGEHTEMDEWRAFKGFRNEMRDRLGALSGNE